MRSYSRRVTTGRLQRDIYFNWPCIGRHCGVLARSLANHLPARPGIVQGFFTPSACSCRPAAGGARRPRHAREPFYFKSCIQTLPFFAGKRSRFLQANALIFCRKTLPFFGSFCIDFLRHGQVLYRTPQLRFTQHVRYFRCSIDMLLTLKVCACKAPTVYPACFLQGV